MHNLLQEIKSLIVCYNFCVIKGIDIYKDKTINSNQCYESSKKLSHSLFNNIKNIGFTIKLG